MAHELNLITTLAAGFGLALLFGFAAERLKIPALVGYLLAGIVIGPATPGFVADLTIAAQLSEIGIMLLMFGVGLHFSIDDLLSVRRIAVPGAIAQMGLATGLGMAMATGWGWPPGQSFVFGLSLSCASTVVLLKALVAHNALDSMNGRIAVGWLVVEDLATVLILVLLPPLAGMLGGTRAEAPVDAALWQTLGVTLIEVSAFLVLMLVIGRRILPWLLSQVARTGSGELFTLAVIAAAIGIAYGAAKLFHVSFALGAFFAGTVLRKSEFSHRAAQESLPLRDAFSVLFFVAVGMLFEPRVLIEQPLQVLGVLAIIIAGKSVVALLLVLAFRYPLNTALIVSASLAQIGEFSFILAGLGKALGLLHADGMSLILAGALISIALNPLLFAALAPLRTWFVQHSGLAQRFDRREDPFAELPSDTERRYLSGQVVLVGYGRVGRRIGQALDAKGIPYVVAEQNRELVEDLRQNGIHAVSGDATDPSVLIQAHIADAAMLVIAAANPLGVRPMIDTARALNPGIEIVLRTHSEDESDLLRESGLGSVFYGEEELAKGMTGHILRRFQPPLS